MIKALNFIDLTGNRFGRLLVLRRLENIPKVPKWICLCDCGNETVVFGVSLRQGHTKSCGCLQKDSAKFKNQTNKRYGKLTAIKKVGIHKHGSILWSCKCDCGNVCEKTSHSLQIGFPSCGCHTNILRSKASTKHGMYKTDEYQLWCGAKDRAKKQHLNFNLSPSDIIIPKFCPVLGIKLEKNVGGNTSQDSSPSLDRIIPSLGYVKGNIKVISQRANVIKNEGTAEEHMKISEYIKLNTAQEMI